MLVTQENWPKSLISIWTLVKRSIPENSGHRAFLGNDISCMFSIRDAKLEWFLERDAYFTFTVFWFSLILTVLCSPLRCPLWETVLKTRYFPRQVWTRASQTLPYHKIHYYPYYVKDACVCVCARAYVCMCGAREGVQTRSGDTGPTFLKWRQPLCAACSGQPASPHWPHFMFLTHSVCH